MLPYHYYFIINTIFFPYHKFRLLHGDFALSHNLIPLYTINALKAFPPPYMNLINANPCHNLQRYILLIYCSPLICLCLVHTNELRSHNGLYSFFLYFAYRLTAFLSSSPYALAFYPLTSHILHQLRKHFYILRKRRGIFFLSPPLSLTLYLSLSLSLYLRCSFVA